MISIAKFMEDDHDRLDGIFAEFMKTDDEQNHYSTRAKT